MRNKIIGLLGIVLSSMFLSGCATKGTITNLDKVKPDDAIMVAKFRILYNGEDVTKKCALMFGSASGFECALDETGYIFAQVSPGPLNLKFVCIRGWSGHSFEPDEITCQLAGGGVVNYLGDVTVDWQGKSRGSIMALSIVSPIAGSVTGVGTTTVSVGSHLAEAQAAFQRQFKTNRILTPALLVVKTQQ
ncbi:MAG: hypothetical protein WCS94_15710 [Verrucomicrobiota bacterium]